jgi:uncharacterized protein (DUF1697 family)
MATCCGFPVARPGELTQHVAFLRAINVGGRNVTMAELRQRFSEMGFADVESFIASGNIVFRTDAATPPAALEERIETALAGALGYDVATFIRSPADLTGIADAAFAGETGSHQVGLLKAKPGGEAAAATLALQTDDDAIAVVGREVHWLRRDTAASRLVNGRFERALGGQATFRSVSTLRRIAAKCNP